MSETDFRKFSPELLDFLEELEENNSRVWFAENKDRYEIDVREPAFAFIRAIRPHLEEISPHFLAIDKKVGGSMMRIHRDVRFSKSKKPYKTNVGIQFRHDMGKDVHAPGFYVHLSAESNFVGVGMWRPDSDSLKKIREAIVEDEEGWRAVKEDPEFGVRFRFGGESLKRPPRGVDKEHPLLEDLKRKDFIAIHEMDEEELYEEQFLDDVLASLWASVPLMRFLCGAIGVAF